MRTIDGWGVPTGCLTNCNDESNDYNTDFKGVQRFVLPSETRRGLMSINREIGVGIGICIRGRIVAAPVIAHRA